MRQLKCPDCEKTFEAESAESMINVLMPHYMAEHKEMMEKGSKEDQKKWMRNFYQNWEKAKEI